MNPWEADWSSQPTAPPADAKPWEQSWDQPPEKIGAISGALRGAGETLLGPVSALRMAGGGLARLAESAVGAEPGSVTDPYFAQTDKWLNQAHEALALKHGEEYSLPGKIANIVGGIAPMAIPLVRAESLLGGAAAMTPWAASAGLNRAEEVAKAGGTLGDSARAGAVSGLGTEAMAMVPFGIAGRLAAAPGRAIVAGALGGAGLQAGAVGPAMRYVENQSLGDSPSLEGLKQPVYGGDSALSDAIVGSVFGGIGGYHARANPRSMSYPTPEAAQSAADRLTKAGDPHEVIQHPTIKGKYQVAPAKAPDAPPDASAPVAESEPLTHAVRMSNGTTRTYTQGADGRWSRPYVADRGNDQAMEIYGDRWQKGGKPVGDRVYLRPEFEPTARELAAKKLVQQAAGAQKALPAPPNTGLEQSLVEPADSSPSPAEIAAEKFYAERAAEEQRRELAMASLGLEAGRLPKPENITLQSKPGELPPEGPPPVSTAGLDAGEPRVQNVEMNKPQWAATITGTEVADLAKRTGMVVSHIPEHLVYPVHQLLERDPEALMKLHKQHPDDTNAFVAAVLEKLNEDRPEAVPARGTGEAPAADAPGEAAPADAAPAEEVKPPDLPAELPPASADTAGAPDAAPEAKPFEPERMVEGLRDGSVDPEVARQQIDTLADTHERPDAVSSAVGPIADTLVRQQEKAIAPARERALKKGWNQVKGNAKPGDIAAWTAHLEKVKAIRNWQRETSDKLRQRELGMTLERLAAKGIKPGDEVTLSGVYDSRTGESREPVTSTLHNAGGFLQLHADGGVAFVGLDDIPHIEKVERGKINGFGAPVVDAMIGAAKKSGEAISARISNVKWGPPADSGPETIRFEMDGVPHEGKLTGRNADSVIGHSPEADQALAARVLLDGEAAPIDAPTPGKVKGFGKNKQKGLADPDGGASEADTKKIGKAFDSAAQAESDPDGEIHHLFGAPPKNEITRIADKVRVQVGKSGWMTSKQAKQKIAEWKAHAAEQGKTSANGQKVVLSLFDLTGEWSKPWEEAGYQVFTFDLQTHGEEGNINNFSVEYFNDMFGSFDGMDVHAILAGCPCTDFAVSGARHFAAKDASGQTMGSVELVKQTLRTIEYFKPAVWAIENPVGRIEKLTGLPPWRTSFDPNHFGDPYTKKTLLWGRFNGDMPVAPVEPTEGSKMHSQYGGKSQATKNARSVTPEGFSYAFFMANNAADHPLLAVAGKYDRLDRGAIKAALDAGIKPEEIDSLVEEHYYQEMDDDAANQALREAAEGAKSPTDIQPPPQADDLLDSGLMAWWGELSKASRRQALLSVGADGAHSDSKWFYIDSADQKKIYDRYAKPAEPQTTEGYKPVAKRAEVPPIEEAAHIEGGDTERVTTEAVSDASRKSAAAGFDPVAAGQQLTRDIEAAIGKAPPEAEALRAVNASRHKEGHFSVQPTTVSTSMKDQDRDHSAIAAALGHVNFDVPGDGRFKVLNTKEALERFKKKVGQSPGFKKKYPPLYGKRSFEPTPKDLAAVEESRLSDEGDANLNTGGEQVALRGKFSDLGAEPSNMQSSLADAHKITGWNFGIRMMPDSEFLKIDPTATPLTKNVPQAYNLTHRVIRYNDSAPPLTKAHGAQGSAEELWHAVDHVGGSRTVSATMSRLDPKTGDIAQEVDTHYKAGGAFARFLHYPVAYEDEMTPSAIRAELFARLGVIYDSDPQAMRAALPKTFEAYHELVGHDAESPVTGTRLSSKVWKFASGPVQAGSGHWNDRLAGARSGDGAGNWFSDPELGRLQRVAAKIFGGDHLGGHVQFRDARTVADAGKRFTEDDVKPVMQAVRDGFVELGRSIRKNLAPQTGGNEAAMAEGIAREHGSTLAYREHQTFQAVKDARKSFQRQPEDRGAAADAYFKRHLDSGRLTPEQHAVVAGKTPMQRAALHFIDATETGQAQPNGLLQQAAAAVRNIYDTKAAEIQALGTGKLPHLIKDYFPHMWKDPTKAEAMYAHAAKAPLEGNKSFMKQRSIPTTLDGVLRGLEPESWNPMDMVILKAKQMDKYLLGQKLMNEYKERGLVTFVHAMGTPDEGLAKINDKIAQVYGPPTVPVKEYVNRSVFEALSKVAANYGLKHHRLTKFPPGSPRRAMGFTTQGENSVTTKFATELSTFAHEISHQLGFKYGLHQRFTADPVMRKQLKALADQHEYKKAYFRKPVEQEATLLEAYIESPETMKEVAPKVYEEFKKFLGEHAELKPILELKHTLAKMDLKNEVAHGGLLKFGEWHAPEAVANVLNNYLSPGLRGKSAVFRGYLGVSNFLNMAQLGLSFFHLGFTSLDAMTSKLALAIEHAVSGEFGKAGKALSEVPLAAFTNYMEGSKLLKEWSAPGSQGGDFAEMVDALKAAGGRVEMDKFYHTALADKMVEAFRSGNIFGGLLRLPGGVIDMAAKPIMEHLVPRQKMGVFLDLARRAIEKLPPDAPREQVREVMAKAWDSVDNRMGQMVYDNLFWNKALKDLSMASVRSVGWNLGTIRELGGGLIDIGKFAGDKARGKEAEFTHRMAYVAALPILAGLMGAMVNYLMTGEGPKEEKDYFFPRTGEKDNEGHDIRVSLPTYMKDIHEYAHDPGKTLTNKLHPMLGMIADMLHNKDYYGTEIRHADDSMIKQALQLAGYVAKGVEPFGIRNLQSLNESNASTTMKAMGFFGAPKAPYYLEQSKAEQMASEFALEHRDPVGRTQAESDRSRAVAQIVGKLRSKDPEIHKQGLADLREGIKSHVIRSEQDITTVMQRSSMSRLSYQVKQMKAGAAVKVYEAATPEERKALKPVVVSKIVGSRITLPEEKRAMLARVKEADAP